MFPASSAIQKTKSNLKRSFIAFEVHYGIDHVDLMMSPVVLFWTPLQMAVCSNSVLDMSLFLITSGQFGCCSYLSQHVPLVIKTHINLLYDAFTSSSSGL